MITKFMSKYPDINIVNVDAITTLFSSQYNYIRHQWRSVGQSLGMARKINR